MLRIAPTWHWDPWVDSFAIAWETSLGHWEGHWEYCDWYTCSHGNSWCTQPIRGVLVTSDLKRSLSPFLWVLEYHVRCKSYFLTKAVTPSTMTKTKSLSHHLLSLASQLLHVYSLDSITYAFSHALVMLCTMLVSFSNLLFTSNRLQLGS